MAAMTALDFVLSHLRQEPDQVLYAVVERLPPHSDLRSELLTELERRASIRVNNRENNDGQV